MPHSPTGSRRHQGRLRAAASGIFTLTLLCASTASASINWLLPEGLISPIVLTESTFRPRLKEAIAAANFGSRKPASLARAITVPTGTKTSLASTQGRDVDFQPSLSGSAVATRETWTTTAVNRDATAIAATIRFLHLQEAVETAPEALDQAAIDSAGADLVAAMAWPEHDYQANSSLTSAPSGRVPSDDQEATARAADAAPVHLVALSQPSKVAPGYASAPTDPSFPAVRSLDIFGSVAISAANAPIGLLSRRALSAAADPVSACDDASALRCPTRLDGAWQEMLEHSRQLEGMEQLDWLNRRVNAMITYKTDSETFGVSDRWSAAHETMQRRTGDCEDYAVMKMWLLRQLGRNSADLFVVVVSGTEFSGHHAVLAVRDGDDIVVLDNRTDGVRSDRQRLDYQPLYSTNEHGLWVHGRPLRPVLTSGL